MNYKDEFKPNLKLEDIYFLTTNPEKTKDFKALGFNVMKNDNEPVEILAPTAELVSLHKSRDTNILNSVVEDTSLWVEDAPYLGTQIKDFWKILSQDESYHGKMATWTVSVCLSTETHFIVSSGVTEGIIKFPRVEDAYHFNQVFAIQTDNVGKEFTHWVNLPEDLKKATAPRENAVKQLKEAVLTNDFSKVQVFRKEDVKDWIGPYQSDEYISTSSKTLGVQIPKIR